MKSSPQTLAIVLTLLMLVPSLPVAAATHTSPPDAPVLPHAKPEHECLGLGISTRILAEVQKGLAGEQPFAQDTQGVPAVCGPSGEVTQVSGVVLEGDRQLQLLRNLTFELQRQLDHRIEATLPEGELTEAILRSRTVLLDDDFDGVTRAPGFGKWSVVTEQGEAPLWRTETRDGANGTQTQWRFGDDEGYARGAHQWLVSPEIDLTALKGDRILNQHLADAKARARMALYQECNRAPASPSGPTIGLGPNLRFPLPSTEDVMEGRYGMLRPACGERALTLNQLVSDPTSPLGLTAGAPLVGGTRLNAVVEAYEMAFDQVVADMPAIRHAAYVDVTYRTNLFPGVDGVRVWAVTGDRAPTRVELADPDFGSVGPDTGTSTRRDCLTDPATHTADQATPSEDPSITTAVNGTGGPQCSIERFGARVLTPMDQWNVTGLKVFESRVAQPHQPWALTGDNTRHETKRLNLTEFQGQRLWLVFEVKTQRNDRGIDIFTRESFPRGAPYGFELQRVYAEGEGYLRNVRVKDVGSNLPRAASGNALIAVPPGDQVDVRLHNAGRYTENLTLTVEFTRGTPAGGTTGGVLATSVTAHTLKPDEVRVVAVPWPQEVEDGSYYNVSANISVYAPGTGTRMGENLSPRVDVNDTQRADLPQAADPNATIVRPANAADPQLEPQLHAGSIRGWAFVRGDTARALTAAHYPVSRTGASFEVCSAVEENGCVPFNIAKKGEPRVLLVGIRNDGAAAEDVKADLVLTLEGVDKTAAVLDGARREVKDLLPGETRGLTWTISPTEAGIWRAQVFFVHADGTSEEGAQRLVYVGRSPGLLCLDDLQTRECGSSVTGALQAPVVAIDGASGNVTAALLDDAGVLVVATQVGETTGALAVRTPDGVWSEVLDLSQQALTTRFGPWREGLMPGSITTLAPGPDGVLYLAGENETLLALAPNGNLTRLTTPPTPRDTYRPLPAAPRNVAQLDFTAAAQRTFVITSENLENHTQLYVNASFAGVPARASAAPRLTVEAPNGTRMLDLNGSTDATSLRKTLDNAVGTWYVNATNVQQIDEGRVTVVSFTPYDASPILAYPPGNFTDGLTVGDKTWFTSTDGGVWRVESPPFNATDGSVQPTVLVRENLTTFSIERARVNYTGELLSIARSPTDAIVVGGTSGFLATRRTDGAWTPATFGDAQTPLAWAFRLNGTAIRDLALHNDSLYAVGPGVLLLHKGTGVWRNVSLPPSGTGNDAALVASTHLGTLMVVEASGQVAVCDVCGVEPAWGIPAIPVPYVAEPGGTGSHPAAVRAVATNANATLLLGEAGLLMDYDQRGYFDNDGDWQTVSPLAPRHGGVVQTKFGSPKSPGAPRDGIWRGYAHDDADPKDDGATAPYAEYRVRMDHYIERVPTSGVAGGVYLLWAELPGQNAPSRNTCGSPDPNVGRDAPGVVNSTVACDRVRTLVTNFTKRSPGYDWQTFESGPIPAQQGSLFFGADVAVVGNDNDGARWAIDDIVVEGRLSPSSPWVPVLAWYGPSTPLNKGTWKNQNLGQFVLATTNTQQATVQSLSEQQLAGSTKPVWEIRDETFDRQTLSAWHITDRLTDRPTWVLNDELFEDKSLNVTGPRLRTNWDTRLISPVLDLGNGIDPVVSFRHAYAFRVQTGMETTTRTPYATPGDAGLLEVQYQILGKDRDASLGDARCTLDLPDDAPCGWSRYYVVRPDVPKGADGKGVDDTGGYPKTANVSFAGYVLRRPTPDETVPVWNRAGPTFPSNVGDGSFWFGGNDALVRSRSYWARNVFPDEKGVISGAADTSRYEEVRVTLREKQCTPAMATDPDLWDCLPVNVTDRPIRFAFHAMTAGNWRRPDDPPVDGIWKRDATSPSAVWNVTKPSSNYQTSFPGEGWYITDFKVLGSPQLGVDIGVSAPKVATGYDALGIGVGPGTRVPVQVTLQNKGKFEVSGYTGTLEVRRVVDDGTQASELVDTVRLDARPALDVGETRVETFNWSVPGHVAEVTRALDAPTDIEDSASFALPAGPARAPRSFEVRFVAEGSGFARFSLFREDAPDAPVASLEVEDTGTSTHVVQIAAPTDAAADGLAHYVLLVDAEDYEGLLFARVTPIEQYLLAARITPTGAAPDEDPTDNVARIGSFIAPLLAKPNPSLRVEFLVSPENATADITRYVPVFLHNTGNVPLECVDVARTITLLQGELSSTQLDAWRTDRPVPPGARVSLAALSSELDPASDLFWRAAKSAPYVFDLSASTCGTTPALTSAAPTRPVSAFSTYLFADVDGGVRGEAVRDPKSFVLGDDWGEADTGFRSQRSLGFGNLTSGRYANDTDSSAVSPVVDISGARTARLAMYHRYAFETGYDGGVVEASADGGRTWQRLQPSPDKLNDLPKGYNHSVPLSAGSALHADHDPATTTLAFTGDSSELPSALDGWVLSEFDLTDFSEVRELDVPYERYTSIEIQEYGPTPSAPDIEKGENVYLDKSWVVGREQELRYWQVDNETQLVRSKTADGNASFWWSGSASIVDDGVRPMRNQLLTIPVDLSGVREGETVRAEWWEWVDRFGGGMYVNPPDDRNTTDKIAPPANFSTNKGSTIDRTYDAYGPGHFLGGVTFNSLSWYGQSFRLNVPQPEILETDGRWYKMSADLTPYTKMDPGRFNASATPVEIGFAYTPFKKEDNLGMTSVLTDAQFTAKMNDSGVLTDIDAQHLYDRGFAIDGFRVVAQREERGVVVGEPRVLMDTAQAWGASLVERCDEKVSQFSQNWNAPSANILPCYAGTKMYDGTASSFAYDRLNASGLSWNLVDKIPGVAAPWSVVAVKDADGVAPTDKLGDGARPSAWYSGYIPNVGGAGCAELDPAVDPYPCLLPGSESRLVTPAINLTRVAGESIDLTFTHRYAFNLFGLTGTHPFSAGGAVEVSRYDPATGKWGGWEQLYSANATLRRQDHVAINRSNITDGSVWGTRGGYSGYTVASTQGSTGIVYDAAPFQSVRVKDPTTQLPCEPGVKGREIGCIDAQFLYTGVSSWIDSQDPRDRDDGWLDERFDVSAYRGQLVRFAFHVYVPQYKSHARFLATPTSTPGDADGLLGPDGRPSSDPLSGWWITDVQVVGKVLEGKPIQVRFRAGTDADVSEGRWQIDDIGLFGSPYRNNLGIFWDAPREGFGLVANSSETIPIVVRNLGQSVRRDLALEVRQSTNLGLFGIHATGGAKDLIRDPEFLLVPGITLAPGQSATVNVTLTAPPVVGADANKTLILSLREFNPVSGAYVQVVDNEVQGFLRRELPVGVRREGAFEVLGLRTEPAVPIVGQPLDLVVTARNPGYRTVTVELACSALTPDRNELLDHSTPPPDRPVARATNDCERVAGNATLARGQWSNLTYRITPTTVGFATFTLKGRIVDGINNRSIDDIHATAAVGVAPVLFEREFDSEDDVTRNWSDRNGRPAWDKLRGHRAAGSLRLGISDEDVASMNNYQGTCNADNSAGYCRAYSPAVDLHNFTATDKLYLSFWHQARFAKWDGAFVTAQVLIDETQPRQPSSWSNDCILLPEDRSQLGILRQDLGQTQAQPPVPADPNPVFGTFWASGSVKTDPIFFTSPNGFEDEWTLARYDLTQQCWAFRQGGKVAFYNDQQKDASGLSDKNYTLGGRTVRFVFHSFHGAPNIQSADPIDFPRGQGHGWFIDDVVVSPFALTISPLGGQSAQLLDDSKKPFSVVLHNRGSFTDLVRLAVNESRSSAPPGSIRPPAGLVELEPGERRIVSVEAKLPRDPSLLPTEFRAPIDVSSTFDKNAQGTTRLDLLFAPRPWPELAIQAEVPRGIVQEGTVTVIPIAIENVGIVDSVATRLRIVDSWPGGSETTYRDLAPITSFYEDADAATRIVDFRWSPPKGSAGLHTLTFTVDPEALGEEYTRTNNEIALTIPVSELLVPDLSISNASSLVLRNVAGGVVSGAKDADVTRYEVTAGELVSFELHVRNLGRAAATNVDVRASIGSLNLPSRQVPYIAAGSEVVVPFNWVAQKGEHSIEFLVRGDQIEASSTNNRQPAEGVTILTVKGFEVTIEVPAFAQVLEPGTQVKVPFTITNTGNAAEELVLKARAPPGTRLQMPREAKFLRAGEVYEDVALLTLSAEAVAGEQVMSIEASARDNPSKRVSGKVPAVVKASYGGSIASADIIGAPPAMTLLVDLVNEGNSLEPWTVNLRLPPGWVAKEQLPARVSVPAHGTARLLVNVTMAASTAPGDRLVGVSATLPDGAKREANLRVQVLPLRAAGLSLAATGEAARTANGQIELPVVVENKGNVQAPFQVVLVDVPTGVALRVEPSSFDLAPGAKAVAKLVVKPQQQVETGNYPVVGYTLFAGVNPDTPEGRANVQPLSVPIVRQDLRLAGPVEFAPRADVEAGDLVTVKVPVVNRGQTAVENVVVHLFVDDVFVAETTVPVLAAGQRTDVTLNWTAVVGTHTLTAVVDPYNDTIDAQREDNAGSALAVVGAGAASGALGAARQKVPGFELVPLAFALALALALRRRRS